MIKEIKHKTKRHFLFRWWGCDKCELAYRWMWVPDDRTSSPWPACPTCNKGLSTLDWLGMETI